MGTVWLSRLAADPRFDLDMELVPLSPSRFAGEEHFSITLRLRTMQTPNPQPCRGVKPVTRSPV